jgi:hypothetical protein
VTVNNTFFKSVSYLLSIATLALVASALSAQAEVPVQSAESAALPATPESVEESVAATDAPVAETASESVETDSLQVANNANILNERQANYEVVRPEVFASADEMKLNSAIPGTAATSATALTRTSPVTQEVSEQVTDTTVAQVDIDPGRTTRGGSSYIGVGGNIGLGGDTALGEGSFSVISKIGLTNNISARPAAIIGDDTVFLIPVTYDFALQTEDPFEEVPYAPYVGGGVAIATGDGDNIGLLLTGGVDFRVSSQFTANAGVNVGFLDGTDVGLTLGIGYTFAGF